MKHFWILSLLVLTLAPNGFSQEVAGAPAYPALERGLEAITPVNIKSDLYFLADDVMGGRDTPSLEQKIAARYLRARLMRLGFQEGYKDSFIYPYELPQWGVNQDECHMILHLDGTDFQWSWGTDYFLGSGGRSDRNIQEASVLFFGSSSDAKNLDGKVKDCWVVIEGERRLSRKVRRDLEQRGALGIILIPEKGEGSEVVEKQTKLFNRQLKSSWRAAPEAGGFANIVLPPKPAESLRRLIGKKKPGAKLDCKISERCSVWGENTTLENVVGIWPGSDPKLRNEVIIVSAHYDHVGKREDGTVYNGADDNGSGTSGLLALCEGLARYGPMSRTVMVMWVSAEEKGLWGSREWTLNPWFPEGMGAVCNINIDMIGRNAGDKLNITPTVDHEEYSWLTKVAEKQCKLEGFPKLGSADDYYGRSDHASFRKNLGVPVIFLFADVHEDYHKPTDTPDKINYDKVSRVTRMVLRVLDQIQAKELAN
ncbi:MAG: hypothetical protein ACI87O_002069 [Planctomycetota bacterium]|jgi:hypothetical protein